jgi:hypothetical protein
VTGAPLSLAFFDPDRKLYGTARSGATLLFEDTTPTAIGEGPETTPRDDGARAVLGDRLALDFEFASPPVRLGGVSARICRVTGEVDGTTVEGVGTASVTDRAPEWDELDAVRTVSALAAPDDGLLLIAQRSREATGHGHELVHAELVHEGEQRAVEDARLSTVYDGQGRQRSAGLELWLPGEDFPRRAAGRVIAGSSLELPGLTVHVAVFEWQLEDRAAIGAYELMTRAEEPAAA